MQFAVFHTLWAITFDSYTETEGWRSCLTLPARSGVQGFGKTDAEGLAAEVVDIIFACLS